MSGMRPLVRQIGSALASERAALEQEVGPIPERDWRRLVAAGDVDFGMSADEIRAAVRRIQRWREADLQEAPEEVVAVAPGDARYDALTEIFALEAAQDPAVLAWRSEHLQSTLPASEVSDWVESHRGQVDVGAVWLRYSGQQGNASLLVSFASPLGELSAVGRRLAARFHWPEPEATTFVLTGDAPSPVFVKGEFYQGEGAANSRVVITADPRTPRHRILEVYAKVLASPTARAVVGPTRARPMKAAAAQLAVLIATSPSESWSRLMKRWNEGHPDHPYDDERRFAKEAREAWDRVVGSTSLRVSKKPAEVTRLSASVRSEDG